LPKQLPPIAALVAAFFVATGAGAAVDPGTTTQPPAAPAPPATADADGDKLFDDLGARLAELAAGDSISVLVALHVAASADHVAELSQRVGGFETARRFSLVDGFAATMTKGQAEALTHMPWVDHLELNAAVHVSSSANGPQRSFGVGLARTRDPGLDGNADGDAAAYSPGDLVAAVIDTGIDAGHVDLDGGKVLAFKDFVNDRTTPYDDHGHGTHVAAILAGTGEARPDRLYEGVAPGAALVGVKVLDSAGYGSLDAVVAGIDWVVANKDLYGIEAINLSLGSSGCADGTDLTSQAVGRAVGAGLVVAVAAGNEGPGMCTVGSPGAAAAALTVGAMSDLGVGGFGLASFSSRGLTADGRVKPDIVGPGVAIVSAAANTTSAYVTKSGTSMATPFVAGVALLMREVNPSLTPQQVKDAIALTAVEWGPAGADGDYGFGRLDAFAALEAVGAELGADTSELPTHSFSTGTLAGTGASTDYALDVTDTAYPIAVTLTMSSITPAAPDFVLYLYNPSGIQVASAKVYGRQGAVSVTGGQIGRYTLRVVSYYGSGSFFVDVSAKFGPVTVTVPSAPTLVAATPGDGSVSLSWAPPNSSGGAAISGYNVYRGTSSGGETLLATVVPTPGTVATYRDSQVVNGTTYYYRVSAVNSVGEGPLSNELSATPMPPTVPGAPTLNSAVGGNGNVSLLWTAPSSNGGAAITGYKIYRGTSPGDGTLLATLGAVRSYTDATVVNGTTYFYRVSAVNSAGEGPLSNELSAKPTRPLFQAYQATSVGSWPEAVAIGDVTGDGRNDVVMTTSFYFDPANDYRLFVFVQRADGTLAPPVSYATASTYTNRAESVAIGDITGDGRKDVVVGISGYGVQVFPQLAAGTLGSPATTATTNSLKIRLGQLDGDARLDVAGVGWGTNTVSVLLNDGNGGLRAPVTYPAQHGGYDDLEVADVTGDGRTDLVVMSGQSFAPNLSVLPQLAAGGFGPAAEYRVGTNILTHGIGVGDVTGDGRNDVVASYGGNQPSSFVAVFAQTAAGLLAAPVSYASYDIPEPLDVADLDLDGRADVVTLHGGWSAAGVYLQTAAGTLAAEVRFGIPYASHYDPHGLAVGDINSDGAPDVVLADYNHGLVVLRNTASAPPATLPGAPTLAATGGDAKVDLSWSEPSNGGAAISGYRIYRGTTSGAETLLTTVGAVSAFTDATAVNGTTYYYEVAAVNTVGEGPRSVERAATPRTVPGAPTLTAATAGSAQVTLAWSAPASDGGAAVTGYRVYRGTTSGTKTLLTALGAVTTYTDTSVVNGTTYFYEVSAVNTAGEGARSNERSATPFAPDTTPPATPARPTLPVAGTNQLALDWAPATDNVGVTSYKLYRNGVLRATVGDTQFLDSGLAAGTTYSYALRAVDAAGNESPLSSTLSAKTLTVGTASTGTLAGVVYNATGLPLANAVVKVTVGGTVKTAKTNSHGVWKLSSLPPGAYAPTISLSGYRSTTLSLTAVAGKTVLAATTLTS
jgi:serine protease AprX